MSPGSCSLMLTLLVSSFGQAHSPSFLPYPCWLASFPCYARAHSSERRWAGTAEVNGVLRLVGARCLSRFTAPSISRWTKPLPAHCVPGQQVTEIGDLRVTDPAAGYAGAYAPQASPPLRVGEARIAQVRARISPRPSKAVGGVGAGITAVSAAGRFRPHLSPWSRRRTHTEHSTLDRHTPGIGRA